MDKKIFSIAVLACIVGFNGCDDSSSAADYQACGSIAHDAVACSEDGTKLVRCNDGALEALTGKEQCTAEQKCVVNDGKAVCEDKDADAPKSCGNIAHDAVACSEDGAQLVKCNDGKLEPLTGKEQCTAEQKCVVNDGKAVCVDKSPCGDVAHGKKTCNMDKIATCNDGVLVDDEGDTQCVDRETRCSDEGGDVKCVAFKDCNDGLIKHNSYGCDGGKMVLCYDGKLEGDNQCEGNTVCQYVEGENYKYAQCIDLTKCGDLQNGEKTCNDEGTQILVCTDGELKEAVGDGACADNQVCVLDQEEVKCVEKDDTYTSIPSLHENYWDKSINEETCYETATLDEVKTRVTGFVLVNEMLKGGNFYIQDIGVTDGKYAGIRVQCDKTDASFCSFKTEDGKTIQPGDLKVGDIVTVEGDGVGLRKCELVITKKNSAVVLTKRANNGKTLTPIVVTANQIPRNDFHNTYYGTLVTIKDITAKTKQQNGMYWEAEDATGGTYITGGILTLGSKIKENTKYDITGIVGNYAIPSKFANGVKPRTVDDIVEIK